MRSMFSGATSFNATWDMSNVKDMNRMFSGARSFSSDVFRWDVSSLTTMDHMFLDAVSFKQTLCRAPWIYSKASKIEMFRASLGSISPKAPPFASRAMLEMASIECLKLSPIGDCPKGPYGVIGDWDVSRVTNMDGIFDYVIFNSDVTE